MHFHPNSIQFSNSIKILLILLITYATTCNAGLALDDVEESFRELVYDSSPMRYCGRRLNMIMKYICQPRVRDSIAESGGIVKKSLIPAFHAYDLGPMENYDDEDMSKNRYKLSGLEDFMPMNDLQFITSGQKGKNRARRGIIDECCKKPCQKIDLIQFCPTLG